MNNRERLKENEIYSEDVENLSEKIISTIRKEDICFGDAYSAFKLAEKKLALYEKNFLKSADSKEVLKNRV